MPRLTEPLALPSGLTLPHRIAKAPMTENLADSQHQATPALEAVYRRWAAGAAGGLLVTGNLMVDRRYLERSRNVVADERLDVARLARVRRASGSSPWLACRNKVRACSSRAPLAHVITEKASCSSPATAR